MPKIVPKSEIIENELIYGDYPEEWEEFDKLKTDLDKKKYLMKTFDLKEEDFKFGNFMCFSTYRQTGLYIIGMDKTFVNNCGDYGYELPHSICKHLADAADTFKYLEFSYFELHKYDYTIVNCIDGEIPSNLKIDYNSYEEQLYVFNNNK